MLPMAHGRKASKDLQNSGTTIIQLSITARPLPSAAAEEAQQESSDDAQQQTTTLTTYFDPTSRHQQVQRAHSLNC